MDSVLTHKQVEADFTHGVMNRLRDHCGLMFNAVPGGVWFVSCERDGFRGHYFLASSSFIVKHRYHLDRDRFELDDKLAYDLPRYQDTIIGRVTGVHYVDQARTGWSHVYQVFADKFSRLCDEDDLDTNHVTVDGIVGIFDDESGALTSLIEVDR